MLIAAPLFSAGGLGLVLTVEAIPSVIGGSADAAAAPRPGDLSRTTSSTSVSMRWLIRDRFMWLLAGLVFIGMGVYNAVATWLQPVLANFGEGGAAGNLIAVLTAGGIVGAAVLPPIVAVAGSATDDARSSRWRSARWRSSRPMFAMRSCGSGYGCSPPASRSWPAFPVVLDWSAIHAGMAREGAAAGFLLMAGNLGGVVLVLVIQGVMGNAYAPLAALAVIVLLGLPLAVGLPGRSIASRPGCRDA